MRQGPRGHRNARGATLIEVLVSIVVLSIGLLGAAALQASALRNNQGSYERAQTTVLGQSILDAMRSNLVAVDAGGYQMEDWTCEAPTAANLAQRDLARWIGDLQAQIGASACGRVSCADRVCTIGIRWNDSRATGGAADHVYEIVSGL